MAKKQLAAPSAPFWLVTFSDMMSLLVCFFVLIISFSTMNQKRFYEVTGSMKDAFGVDKVALMTKIIELDGVPFLKQDKKLIPLPMAVVAAARVSEDGNPDCGEAEEGFTPRQVDEESARLEEAKERWALADRAIQAEEAGQRNELAPQAEDFARSGRPTRETGSPGRASAPSEDGVEEQPFTIRGTRPERPEESEDTASPGPARQQQDGQGMTDGKDARQDEVTKLLNAVLSPEIDQGLLSVEERDGEIKITFPAAATFDSGSDGIAPAMLSAVDRVAGVLAATQGEVLVNGHTDNIPIATARFPSNWELSTARAISVLRRLELMTGLDRSRLSVMGLADTRPLAPNDTPDNRAKNRRVEIVLRQP